MEPPSGWEAQLGQFSAYRLGQLVRQTGPFVQLVRRRWAAGQFVPSWCTVAWIDGLAWQVVRAEQRLADNGPAAGDRPPTRRRSASPPPPAAVPVLAAVAAQRQLAAIRMAVRRAKHWEPAAHERAAELHERSAELQARLGHHDRADQARRYAADARDRIVVAVAEQAAWEATLASFARRPPAAPSPPDPPEPTT